jgi:hypothetical protein
MENLSVIANFNLQTQNTTSQSFEEYFHTKEIVAGRIEGELSIHQTEIITEDNKIAALAMFFKPSHSETEIPLGLVAAPMRISPNLEGLNGMQKIKMFLKTVYKIQVLRNMDRRLRYNPRNIFNTDKSSSSFPHVKSILHAGYNIIYFRTAYPADTLAQFIEQLHEITEEKIPVLKKRLLLLTVFKNIFVMLDNFPRKSHGDFHPRNILVSIQHEEPASNADQPLYTPSHIKTHAIDIGSIQNTISPSLKQGKLFYTKQDDLQTLFTHLEQWWNPQLHNLLGITKLTREKILHMLENQDNITQQKALSTTVQDYQLQRLNYLLNKQSEINIHYEKEELQAFSAKIHNIYKVDEEGEGAPTVIMPYTLPARIINN